MAAYNEAKVKPWQVDKWERTPLWLRLLGRPKWRALFYRHVEGDIITRWVYDWEGELIGR